MKYIKLDLLGAVKRIDKSKELFLDLETIGLYGTIRLAQFMQAGWDAAIVVDSPCPITLAAHMNKVNVVAHNVHYEVSTIQDQTDTTWQPDTFNCTFLAARIALPRLEKFTLDSVMTKILGYDPYEAQGLNKRLLQKSNWGSPVLSKSQLAYAATDVYYMPEVWEAIKAAADTPSYQLDIKTLQACFKIQHNGIKIDRDRVAERIDEDTAWLANNPIPINANSWQQVRKWIGCTESDDDALSMIELKVPQGYEILTHGDIDSAAEKAAMIRKTRMIKKRLSTLHKYDRPRLIGKFKPSAISGRMTSDSENLQQIPRALKDCFGGTKIIFADYAQLELRTICAILGISRMEDMYRKNIDIHTFTAEMLDIARLRAKGANFGLLYGAGAKTLVGFMRRLANVVIEEREANSIRRKWLNLWTEIAAWHQRGISKWRKGQLGYTPLGRPYKAKLMTDYLNVENQGAGAEVAKLAFSYLLNGKGDELPRIEQLRNKYNLAADELIVVNFIHDSYIIEYYGDNEEVYKEAAIMLGETMQEAWFEMSKLYKIHDLPMPVDVRVANNWKAADSDDGEKLFQVVIEPYKTLERVQ